MGSCLQDVGKIRGQSGARQPDGGGAHGDVSSCPCRYLLWMFWYQQVTAGEAAGMPPCKAEEEEEQEEAPP